MKNILFLLLIFLVNPVMAHEAHCRDSELGGLMKEMKSDLKKYVSSFRHKDINGMKMSLDDLILNTTKSKDKIPLKFSDREGHSILSNEDLNNEQEKLYFEYVEEVDKLLMLLNQLRNEKNDIEIKKLLVSIKEHTKNSHKEYREECD